VRFEYRRSCGDPAVMDVARATVDQPGAKDKSI
jgi:hypothetical protein